MRCQLAIAALLCFTCSGAVLAGVHIDESFEGMNESNATVPPSQIAIVPIGSWRVGDKLAIRITASNRIYTDITARVAGEDEAKAYRAGSACKGKLRTATPFVLNGTIVESGNKYLVLDNSYANFISKKIAITLNYRKRLTQDEVESIRAPLEKLQSSFKFAFADADFNLVVKPCGMSNAFSDRKTAEITLCSELLHELATSGNNGTLIATIFHEYGHSLLNRWGEPGSSEEDMADQFATAMLLKGGEEERRLLQQWVQFWMQRDSRAEAMGQLRRSDTHSLSIQRARNIQDAINHPEELTRRWNKMLYRHMTKEFLDQIILRPSRSDDLDLAKEARALK